MIALIVVITFLAAVALDHITLRYRETHKAAAILGSPTPSHS